MLALLSASPNDRRLPWVETLIKDMRTLRRMVALCAQLPDQASSPGEWNSFVLKDKLRWKQAVNTLFFFDSILDRDAASAMAPVVRNFTCDECEDAFATEKALKVINVRSMDSERHSVFMPPLTVSAPRVARALMPG